MSISDEDYEKLVSAIEVAQATGTPCVLIVGADDGVDVLTATNSKYEAIGILDNTEIEVYEDEE